jgi:hypothetical protein
MGPSLASVPLRGAEDCARDDSSCGDSDKQNNGIPCGIPLSLSIALAPARPAVRTSATMAAATARSAPAPASTATAAS